MSNNNQTRQNIQTRSYIYREEHIDPALKTQDDRLCTFVWQINTANVTHDLLITALYILLMYDLEINHAGLDGGLLKPFQYPRVNNMFQLYTSQV